jgi:hypothetical protein
MAFPDNGLQKLPATNLSMSTIRDVWGLLGATSISIGGLRNDYFYGTPRNIWFDGGSNFWLSTPVPSSGPLALGDFKNTAVRPWVTYNIGSWTVATEDIGLPFSDPINGETIYGFSSFGYRPSTSTGMNFGSISNPKGFVYGGVYNELRQMIYRPAVDNGQFWLRISDAVGSIVPAESIVSGTPSFYRSGSVPGGAPGGLLFQSSYGETTPEKSRVYNLGYNINNLPHGTSGLRGLMFTFIGS